MSATTPILYAHDKHEVYLIDATHRDLALLKLFRIFDDNEYYGDLTTTEPDDDPTQEKQRVRMKDLYDKAKTGDAVAAERLLTVRKQRGYEYEDDWRFTETILPKLDA